jgi:hypothetical protein
MTFISYGQHYIQQHIIVCDNLKWKICFVDMRIIIKQIVLDEQGTTGVSAFNWLKYGLTSNQINTLLITWIYLSHYQISTEDSTQWSYKHRSVASILHHTTTQTYNKHMKVRNADSVLLTTSFSKKHTTLRIIIWNYNACNWKCNAFKEPRAAEC